MTTDPQTLRQQVGSFPFWYHKIELPFGITTPGWAPLDARAYGIPTDLSGKRVLDVGAWDGYWTFEALKRGALQAVAIDDFSDYLGKLEHGERRAWETFDLCREALGYSQLQCPRFDMTVYDATPKLLGGQFDVVFFFGTIYHLRHPMLALDRLSALCQGEIFLESAILDDYSPYRAGKAGYGNNDMVMEFYPDDQYSENDSNWWSPTLTCLKHMVRAAGFDEVEGWKLTSSPQELCQCRGFVHGVKKR